MLDADAVEVGAGSGGVGIGVGGGAGLAGEIGGEGLKGGLDTDANKPERKVDCPLALRKTYQIRAFFCILEMRLFGHRYNMNPRPYSVFVKHRPVRTGFLVDTSVFAPGSDRFEVLVDAIIRHNYQAWGGRTNPIIFFSGDSLRDQDWKQLDAVDVDCLKCFSPLPKNLVHQLDDRLQPWNVEEIRQPRPDSPHVESHGVGCPPTPDILRSFREKSFDLTETKFVMFDFAPKCELLIQRFVHRNFGTYDQWFDQKSNVRRAMALERLLSKIEVEHILISDRASLAKALTLLAGTPPHIGYQAPLQFIAPSRLPTAYYPEIWPQDHGVYQAIVGDDAETLSEFWNGAFWKRIWTAPYAHQLWLPTDLARDPILHEPLRIWLRHCTGTGNSNAKNVEFLSSSLPSAELDVLRQNICNGSAWAPRSYIPQPDILESRRRKAEEEVIPVLRGRAWTDTQRAVRYSGNSQEETFTLGKPEILTEEVNPDCTWMVDVQIELLSSTWPTAPEQNWWMVPRRNSGGLLAAMLKGGARINRSGLFSIRVENQTGLYSHGVKPELKIDLPDQLNVVPALITRPQNQCVFRSDLRYSRTPPRPEITHVRYSDKGKYLSGLIQVFGSFWTAKEFCDRRFWRSKGNFL
jgi:hypothetical protein